MSLSVQSECMRPMQRSIFDGEIAQNIWKTIQAKKKSNGVHVMAVTSVVIIVLGILCAFVFYSLLTIEISQGVGGGDFRLVSCRKLSTVNTDNY